MEADADNLGPAVLAVAWSFAVLAAAVVGARIYVRLQVVRRLRIDDYIILLTLVSLPSSVQNSLPDLTHSAPRIWE